MKLTETETTTTEKTTYNSEDIQKAFKDTDIYGFTLIGMDAHTYSIKFQHKHLGLEINICPECCMGKNSAPRELRVQISGTFDNLFSKELPHHQKTYGYQEKNLEPCDVETIIETFIEEELR